MTDLSMLYSTALVEQPRVPNEIRPCKLAVVGEAPGAREVDDKRPFVGPSGGMLFGELSKFGMARYECSTLNVTQYQPPGNDINKFVWSGHEIQDGITSLDTDLRSATPNLVLCLGNAALHVMKHGNAEPPKDRKGNYNWPSKIGYWRGSLFVSHDGKYKCIAAYHPANVLRNYSNIAYLRADLAKTSRHARTREWQPPIRAIDVQPRLERICARLATIKQQQQLVALDIEGGLGTMSCISFATSSQDAFIVPLTNVDGTSYWCEEDERIVWRALAGVLSDPGVPKILQNCLYDAFVLSYGYKCPLRGIVDDIMLKHWELLPELEKSLAVQTSLYTDEPYYKDARASTGETLWTYCCKDSAVTFECNEVLTQQLKDPGSYGHYRFNMKLIPPTLYMQHVGFEFDHKRRAEMVKELEAKVWELQTAINERLFGKPTAADTLKLATEKCVFKKHRVDAPSDLLGMPKKAYEHSILRIAQLVAGFSTASSVERGELYALLDFGINVDSNKQMKFVLYESMKLPVQYKKEHGRKTTIQTADALAILNLYVFCQEKNDKRSELLLDMLRLRSLKDRVQNLNITTDADGRIRSTYNVVGSESGRYTCYASLTGTGTNLQTITSRDRCLFKAPFPDHDTFQADLSGADGWTVACELAALGDPTMLNDYLAGLKPAKVVAVLYMHGSHAAAWDVENMRKACAEVDSKSWEYFAFKCVQHGTNYGMSPETVQDTILKQSYKKGGTPIYVPLAKCAQFQSLYLTRYGSVRRNHARHSSLLRSTGQYRSASGHVRTFFGRREDHATLKEFHADGPQENTTYATSLAMLRLWSDPENRPLIVKPLHQMHDAIIGCWPTSQREWARKKVHEWFDNEIEIAGRKLVIPFEGGFGPSWGELENEI